MLWEYKPKVQEKFKNYHYSSLNDKEFTFSQVYYPVERKASLITEKESNVIELSEKPNEKLSFIDVLFQRKSYGYSLENNVAVTKELISKFCHVAFFGTEIGRRSYPSGGSQYNVNPYFIFNESQVANDLCLCGNVCALDFEKNNLLCYQKKNWKSEVAKCFIQENLFKDTKFAIVLGVNLDDISEKYTDISYKLVQLEAGHIGQNIQLAASLYGLKTVPLQGYYDVELGNLIGKKQTILYAFLVG